MTADRLGTGRAFTRPVLVLAGLAILAALGVAAMREGAAPGGRGPIAVPNPGAAAPAESTVGTVRHVFQREAPERLVPDTTPPTTSVELLWFEGRAAGPDGVGGRVVLDGVGGVLRFDARLAPERVSLALDGRVPLSVAAATDGGFWMVDGEGALHRFDADGRLAKTVTTSFDYPAVGADDRGGAWLWRSTELFSYRLASADDPILEYVSEDGGQTRTVGSIVLPEHVLLAEIANAGHGAVGANGVYFTPFIRDEVVAYSRAGDTLWIARRGLPQGTPEPRLEIGDDGPMIDYAPVNLGVTLGPDGLLYVLSIPGFTTSESRLDVYDPVTGVLQRSAALPTPLPTVAADHEGRVYLLDPLRLLTGIAPTEREAFAAFDLERLEGGRMASTDVAGKVVLVNFWASWCAPCRVEMPGLDSLRRSIEHPDFVFLTMNEDVRPGDAKAFVQEYGFDFPVLLGRGKLRQQYHYVGLPFTVLLDRHGRVVHRWIGFAGAEQLAGIRAVTRAELEREGSELDHDGPDAGGKASAGHRGVPD